MGRALPRRGSSSKPLETLTLKSNQPFRGGLLDQGRLFCDHGEALAAYGLQHPTRAFAQRAGSVRNAQDSLDTAL